MALRSKEKRVSGVGERAVFTKEVAVYRILVDGESKGKKIILSKK